MKKSSGNIALLGTQSAIVPIVLLVLFCLEVFLTSAFRHVVDNKTFTIFTSFLTSLTLGVLAIYFSLKPKETKSWIPIKTNGVINVYQGINILLFISAFYLSNAVFGRYEISMIDASFSDVIPQQMVLCKRLLAGEFPYQMITIWGHHLYPTYLPFHWLPYSLAEWINFDYRWVPFIIYSIATLFFQHTLTKSKINVLFKLCIASFPFLALIIYINGLPIQYAHTSETMIAGYYLLLALGVLSNNKIFKAGSLLLCLLSRYSLVLWIPLYFYAVLIKKKSDAYKISAMVLIGILIFYVFPFLTQDFSIFSKGFDYHSSAADIVWNYPEKPFVLQSGIGFGSLYYDYLKGTHSENLKVLQISHYVSIISVVIVLFVLMLKNIKAINMKLFIIGSLKIYLCFFLHFIQLPFEYLFFVLLVISLPILVEILKINEHPIYISK